jgi:hypothetical protein
MMFDLLTRRQETNDQGILQGIFRCDRPYVLEAQRVQDT